MSSDQPGAKRPLPERPNLRHLKGQAKDLFKAGGASSITEAQFQIARLYGFASWPKLVQHVESVNPEGLGAYEQLAAAVAAAYTAGDAEAVRELNREHGTWLVHDREPAAMQARLPRWFASEAREPELALDLEL